MLTYLRRLLWDEGSFIGLFRGGLAAVGLAIESGRIPFPDEWAWLGIPALGAALLMRSSVPARPKDGGGA